MNTNKTKIAMTLSELKFSNSEIAEELESRRYDGKIVPKWVIDALKFAGGLAAATPLIDGLVTVISGLKGGAILKVLADLGGFLSSYLAGKGIIVAASLCGLLKVVVLAIILYVVGSWVVGKVFKMFEQHRNAYRESMYANHSKSIKSLNAQIEEAAKVEQVSKIELSLIASAAINIYAGLGALAESKYSAANHKISEDSIASTAPELFKDAMGSLEGLLNVIPLAEIETNPGRDALVMENLRSAASFRHAELILKERGSLKD